MIIRRSIRLWSRVNYRRATRLPVVAALVAGALLLAAAPAAYASTYERRPVLFVHGVESAGSNFASQEMRFESNGYPHGWVEALDYNSLGAAAENYNGEIGRASCRERVSISVVGGSVDRRRR